LIAGHEVVVEQLQSSRVLRAAPVRRGRDGRFELRAMAGEPSLLGLGRPVAAAEDRCGQREQRISGHCGVSYQPGREQYAAEYPGYNDVRQSCGEPPGQRRHQHHRDQHRTGHQAQREIFRRTGRADGQADTHRRTCPGVGEPLPQPQHRQHRVEDHRQFHHGQPTEVQHQRHGPQQNRREPAPGFVAAGERREYGCYRQHGERPVQQFGQVHSLVSAVAKAHRQQKEHLGGHRVVAVAVVLQLADMLCGEELARHLQMVLQHVIGVGGRQQARHVGRSSQGDADRARQDDPRQGLAVESKGDVPALHDSPALPCRQQDADGYYRPPQPCRQQAGRRGPHDKHGRRQAPQAQPAGRDDNQSARCGPAGQPLDERIGQPAGGDHDQRCHARLGHCGQQRPGEGPAVAREQPERQAGGQQHHYDQCRPRDSSTFVFHLECPVISSRRASAFPRPLLDLCVFRITESAAETGNAQPAPASASCVS